MALKTPYTNSKGSVSYRTIEKQKGFTNTYVYFKIQHFCPIFFKLMHQRIFHTMVCFLFNHFNLNFLDGFVRFQIATIEFYFNFIPDVRKCEKDSRLFRIS